MRVILSLVLVTVLFPFTAVASEPFASMTANGATIEWHPSVDHAAIVLSVQRANGEVTTETFANGRVPALHAGELGDGTFAYELRLVPRLTPRVKARLAVAREAGDEAEVARLQREAGLERTAVQTGSFTIRNGAILSPATEEAGGRTPRTNEFFNEDVSATGGICAGFDCTSAESYGFATIKLKENNLRIKFEDTSSSAGFSTTDWQLSAGDTTATGVEKFFVEDLTAATVPLLIEGGTPSNALYIDSTGRIGMRTSVPAKDLHISTGNSPTIRLEQNATQGLGIRSWEMMANDANFVLRDLTGATNPVVIRTAAPSSSLVVDSSGRLGLGTLLPSYQIHHSGSGARLDAGNWINGSSRATKQDIRQLDGAAAFDALKALEPVTYAYRSSPADTHVGFIAEDVPELVATPDRKGLSPMDVAALLTKVVQEQQKTIEELKARLECLEEKEE